MGKKPAATGRMEKKKTTEKQKALKDWAADKVKEFTVTRGESSRWRRVDTSKSVADGASARGGSRPDGEWSRSSTVSLPVDVSVKLTRVDCISSELHSRSRSSTSAALLSVSVMGRCSSPLFS